MSHEFSDGDLAGLLVPRDAFDLARRFASECSGMSVTQICSSLAAWTYFPRRVIRRLGTDSLGGRIALASIKALEFGLIDIESKKRGDGNEGPPIYCDENCPMVALKKHGLGRKCMRTDSPIMFGTVCPVWAEFVARLLGY